MYRQNWIGNAVPTHCAYNAVCPIFRFHLCQVLTDDEASTLQIFLFLLLSTASLMFIPFAIRSSFTLSIHFFGCLPLLYVPAYTALKESCQKLSLTLRPADGQLKRSIITTCQMLLHYHLVHFSVHLRGSSESRRWSYFIWAIIFWQLDFLRDEILALEKQGSVSFVKGWKLLTQR